MYPSHSRSHVRYAQSFLYLGDLDAEQEQQQPEGNDDSSQFSDKIFLPAAVLEDLHNSDIEYPLHFELSILGRAARAYVGVKEFTAPENTVLLTDQVCEELNIQPDEPEPHNLFVKYVQLPKASKVIFQPKTADFFDILDHKSTLESVIRNNFSSLSTRKTLRFYYSRRKYEVYVVEVEPSDAPAVSLFETDCEVEFKDPLNTGVDDGRQTTKSLAVDKPIEDSVQGFENYKYYRWTASEQLLQEAGGLLQEEDDKIGVKFTLSVEGGDVDVYIAPPPNHHPTLLHHEWSMNDVGGGTVTIFSGESLSPSKREWQSQEETESTFQLQAGQSLYVGVCAIDWREYDEENYDKWNATQSDTYVGGRGTLASGFQQSESVENTVSYTLSVNLTSKKIEERKEEPAASNPAAISGEETARCNNCGTLVPQSRLQMHEAFCARNNQLCEWEGCGKVFKRGSEDYRKHLRQHRKQHFLYNKPRKCDCNKEFKLKDLIEHKKSECPERLIVCKFCGDRVRAGPLPTDWHDRLGGLTGHESYCGSRTVPCDMCGRSIKMKSLEYHVDEVHRNPSESQQPSAAQSASSAAGQGGHEEVYVREGLVLWNCPRCGVDNVDIDTNCQRCNIIRPSLQTPASHTPAGTTVSYQPVHDNDSDYDMDISSPEGSPQARSPLCANKACNLYKEQNGKAYRFSLCNRCYRVIIQNSIGDDEQLSQEKFKEKLRRHLWQTYKQQLTSGCNNLQCRNKCCRRGRDNAMNDDEAAVAATGLAIHGVEPSPRFYVCVRSSPRPPVAQNVNLT